MCFVNMIVVQIFTFFCFSAKTADMRKMQHPLRQKSIFQGARLRRRRRQGKEKTCKNHLKTASSNIGKLQFFLLFSCRQALLLKSLPQPPKKVSRRASGGLPGSPGGLKSINTPSPRTLLGAPGRPQERSGALPAPTLGRRPRGPRKPAGVHFRGPGGRFSTFREPISESRGAAISRENHKATSNLRRQSDK